MSACEAHDDSGPEAQWRRADPRTILAVLVRSLMRAVLPIGAVALGGGRYDNGPLVAVPLLFGVVVLAGLFAWLGWWRMRYRVGASDVRVEQGLLSRSARTVPYERIQDVSLEQQLIPRLLGLVEVRFETGAGGKDELKLAFVSQAEGERLRESVRARVDGADTADVAASEAREPAEDAVTLFAMGPKRLLTFGLFEFSLVAFAALAGAAQQFDSLLPFDLWDLEGWEERLSGPGAWLASLGTLTRAVGVALALGVFVLVGLLTGVLRTVLRDYGFRLERTAKGFRRRRGLLTRTDVVMPLHRVQAITVSTGVLRRLWGWHGLSFVSLAEDAGSTSHAVAPFAQLDEIAPIARAAGFALPGPDLAWQKPDPRYFRDRAFVCVLVPAVAAFCAFVAALGAVVLALGILGGILVLREYWHWRHARHALAKSLIFAQTGWLSPSLSVASRVKLHSVEIAQGPLARRGNYATLKFGLAGSGFALPGLPLAEARQLRDAVLASITAVDFAALPR